MCYGQIALGVARYNARKSHGRCEWCGEPILAGERYERARIIDEDAGPYVSKAHVECAEAAGREASDGDGCVYWSEPRRRGMTIAEMEIADEAARAADHVAEGE